MKKLVEGQIDENQAIENESEQIRGGKCTSYDDDDDGLECILKNCKFFSPADEDDKGNIVF